MTKLEDFEFDSFLIDERSHEIILIYDIWYKDLIGSKHLRIIFDKIDGVIRICDGTRYFVLLAPEKYHAICNGIRYLISLILLIEKILALDDALMLIKSLLNKDKNHYY